MPKINIGKRWIGDNEPTYFIADISANHDGDINRAKALIRLAAESGANAVKFQNFRASKIVSQYGFDSMKKQVSHQAKWKKPVYRIYEEATLPWEWTGELKREADDCGIDYFSTPYDLEAVDMLDPYVSLFKVGSGDITWPEIIEKIASKNKPIFLATGASTINDVMRAMGIISPINSRIVLMQCNTNYTGNSENFRYINLNVLKAYHSIFPDVILGLSDHTFGYAIVLGAVALGARVIEKHFTDDINREGPDHPFSMIPSTWREMVDCTRQLELSLGDENKDVAANEKDTVVVQRRCLRAADDLKAGIVLERKDIDVLRPAPEDAVFPYDMNKILGLRLKIGLSKGEYFRWDMFDKL